MKIPVLYFLVPDGLLGPPPLFLIGVFYIPKCDLTEIKDMIEYLTHMIQICTAIIF